MGSVWRAEHLQLRSPVAVKTTARFEEAIGGVLFTLEVILLDFSIRAFAPVVSAQQARRIGCGLG